jgi:predicted phosphate transport protein (TIGR00153 family)
MPASLLGSLLGKSPIKPMQEHMAKAQACAAALLTFYDAAQAGDWVAAETAQQQIGLLEHEADEIKRTIRVRLPNSLFLPVPRADLLDLLRVQDKIANGAKDVAGLMLGRKMQMPVPLQPLMRQFLEEAIATSAQALKAINELDELVETGFQGRELAVVAALIAELDALENTNDKTQITLRAQLHALEKDLPPVDVMFVYRIIEEIADLADIARRVGSRLQILIAH